MHCSSLLVHQRFARIEKTLVNQSTRNTNKVFALIVFNVCFNITIKNTYTRFKTVVIECLMIRFLYTMFFVEFFLNKISLSQVIFSHLKQKAIRKLPLLPFNLYSTKAHLRAFSRADFLAAIVKHKGRNQKSDFFCEGPDP